MNTHMLCFTLHKTEHVSRDLVTKKPSPSPAIGHSTASDLSAGQGQVFRVFDSPVIDTGMTNRVLWTRIVRNQISFKRCLTNNIVCVL